MVIIGGAHVGITSSQILEVVMTAPVFVATVNLETGKNALLKVLEKELLVEKYFVAGSDLTIDNLKDNTIVYDLIDQLLISEKRELTLGLLSDMVAYEKL